MTKKSALGRALAENETLRAIAKDLHWMARRYADGRQSYAPSLFNEHTRKLLDLGVKLNPTGDGTIWAHDRMGRAYDGLTPEEAAMEAGALAAQREAIAKDLEAEADGNLLIVQVTIRKLANRIRSGEIG